MFVVATDINATMVSPPRSDQVPGQYVTSDATWKPTSAEEWRRDGMYWFNTNIVKSAAKSSDVKVESVMSERKNKTNSNIRLCTECKRFISGRNFWRHQCCGDKPT